MTMRIIIHHAYFLPWLGYFSKLEFADALVVLDDVGFRRDHIKRVRVFDNRGAVSWVGVPVGNNWSRPCNQIHLPTDTGYALKLVRFLRHSYGRAKHFAEIYPQLSEALHAALCRSGTIVDANIDILRWVRRLLSRPDKPVLLASELATPADRTLRIHSICEKLGASEILIGDGQMKDVHNLDYLREHGIRVFQQNFFNSHPRYPQLHATRHHLDFVRGLSIVDPLFNVGEEAVATMITDSVVMPVEVSQQCPVKYDYA